jgi:uncharacterized protein YkwD
VSGTHAKGIGVSSVALVLLAAGAVHAEPPGSIVVRGEACPGEGLAVIETSAALDEVARELSRGGDLQRAIDRVGYASSTATLLYIRSPLTDQGVREVIEDQYCLAAGDRQFTEYGIYRSGDEAWIVLAAPIEQPGIEDTAAVAARVLELVNAARVQPRRCGDRRMEAAPPLALSRELSEAAARHARDMAQQGALTHLGSDGSQPADRVSAAGYRWRSIGENIAAGQSSAAAVVTAWLESPGHCANIMGAQFAEMGVAFALAHSRRPGIYWAQEFASPR